MGHVPVFAVLAVQVATALVMSSSTQTPTRTASHALCSSAAILLPAVALVLAVRVVVGAVVGIVVLPAAVSSRAALAGTLFAAVSVFLFLIAGVFSLLLLCRREETTGYFLKELVGNLLCAVADCFEG